KVTCDFRPPGRPLGASLARFCVGAARDGPQRSPRVAAGEGVRWMRSAAGSAVRERNRGQTESSTISGTIADNPLLEWGAPEKRRRGHVNGFSASRVAAMLPMRG